MTEYDLTGRTAWVTGAARNIGKAIADELAARGADVAVTNRSNTAELEATVEELRARHDATVTGVQVDVGDPDAVDRAVDRIHDEVGGVDVLVNNAAIRPHNPIEEISLAEWNDVVRTNLTGPFLCARAVVPDMRDAGGGRIVSLSGSDAFFGKTDRVHVASTKAALFGYTRALAQELAPDGIRVNCIVPGIADTERTGEGQASPNTDAYREHIPLGYICDPDEIAPSVAFLAGEGGDYITGQVISVNGGLFPTVRF